MSRQILTARVTRVQLFWLLGCLATQKTNMTLYHSNRSNIFFWLFNIALEVFWVQLFFRKAAWLCRWDAHLWIFEGLTKCILINIPRQIVLASHFFLPISLKKKLIFYSIFFCLKFFLTLTCTVVLIKNFVLMCLERIKIRFRKKGLPRFNPDWSKYPEKVFATKIWSKKLYR